MEYWTRNAPDNVTPGTRYLDHTKYNSKNKTIEQSRATYDKYGRQNYRVDYTDHEMPNGNGHPSDKGHKNPHLHIYTYHPRGTQGAKQGKPWVNGTKGDKADTGRKEKTDN